MLPRLKLLLAVALTLLAAACGSSAPTAPAAPSSATAQPGAAGSQPAAAPKALKKVSLLLDWIPSGHQSPFFLAKQEGLFAKQGLDVTINFGKGSGSTIQQVGQGNVDFGFADGGELIQYRAKNTPVKMVFDLIRSSPSAVIFPKSLGWKSPKDMEGHSIATTAAGSVTVLLPVFYRNAGVDAAKVKRVVTDAATRDTLLLTKKTDAIASLTFSEYPVLLAKGMDTTWFKYADYGLNLPAHGVLVNDALLAKDPDTVRGFVAAVAQAVRETEQNPQAAIAAEQKSAGTSDFNPQAELLALKGSMELWHTKSTEGHPLGWMAPDDWSKGVQLLEQYMQMAHIDPTSAYTNEFVPQG